MQFDYDCFIIGGGSGGVRAAKLASQAGKKVGLAEEFRFGGTCVIRGCVPKKLMLFASDFSQSYKDSMGYGWNVENTNFDWNIFLRRKDEEIDRLEKLYHKGLIENGVHTYKARAKLIGDNKIILNSEKIISSRYIILATGGRPSDSTFEGAQFAVSSNEIMNLRNLPKNLIIVGGGYIACEFANIFKGLGIDVTLIYRGKQILRGFDEEVAAVVQDAMMSRGIKIMLNTNIEKVEQRKERDRSCISVRVLEGETLIANELLLAIGRTPNTHGLGLDKAGVSVSSDDAVKVDKFQQTSAKGIFAIGDVTNRINLTPVAIRDGVAVIKTLFGSTPTSPDHLLVPSAVFTRPEIGTVGLTEKEAKEKYDVKVYRTTFRPMYNTIAENSEKYLMKMIVEKKSEKILGLHIVGSGAAELIQVAAIPIKMGATKEDFDQTVAVHPTLAEELVTLK